MRISDWSSDVCSSDLGRVVAELRRIDLQMAAAAATPTGFLKGAFRTLQQQVRGDAVDRKNRHAATDRQMQRAPVARDGAPAHIERSEERSVGTASVSTCRCRWSQLHITTTQHKQTRVYV